MGCSPALGFVHTGHERSFVYDIADLYKAETTIPLAFQVARDNPDDIGAEMRRRTRDVVSSMHLLERMVCDIRQLLLDNSELNDEPEVDEVSLWDDKNGSVRSGISYGEERIDEYEESFIEGYGTMLGE
jgi:CRISPR-associated protein Cas1